MFNRWCFPLGVIIVITLKYDAVLSSPLKIVNGIKAELGDAPYMAQLLTKEGDFHCGGSIIAPDWILTAAHCVLDEMQMPYGIIYGSLRLNQGDEKWPNNSVLVKRRLRYPKYDYDAQIYDVALLQLEKKISFGDNVQPVRLPESDDVPFHVDGLMAGWGAGSQEGPSIVDLQKITAPLLSQEECIEKLNYYEFFVPAQCLCVESHNDGICYGDSGGPYVINGTQYGVASALVDDCATHPGIFSRVSSPEQLGWIRETITS